MSPESNIVTNKAEDQAYFTITPRLVWALARDPYDLALWMVIKDVAGDAGKCILSTPQLATLAMMSEGKVQDYRKFLIEAGLLTGSMHRDPGYPQPVWHMEIPNIWAASFKWAVAHLDLKDRIEFKEAQKNASKEAKEHSCGEKGGAPHEKGGAPGERKNIQKEYPKEERDGLIFEKFETREALMQAIKEHLKGDFEGARNVTAYRRYVEPLWISGVSPESITFATQSEPARDWLSASGRYLFANAMIYLIGRRVQVLFTVADPLPEAA